MSSPARRALVQGGGPAGWSAAMLLRQRGWQVDLASAPASAGPVVLLNPVTWQVLCDVWGWSLQTLAGRWAAAHPLTERLVAWQTSAPPATERPAALPDSAAGAAPEPVLARQAALALPLADLTAAMAAKAERAGVRRLAPGAVDPGAYAWVIEATGRASMPSAHQHQFGARQALSVQVRLQGHASAQRCVLEAVAGGWLFLIPQGGGVATLQAMLASPCLGDAAQAHHRLLALVAGSRRLGGLLGELPGGLLGTGQSPVVRWAAMPSLHLAPARPGHLVVGDAALAHDPLSGEGIGTGLRTALLAVAVMAAIDAGEPAPACLAHYQQRLAQAAQAHVRRCLGLYQQAHHAHAWQPEITAMQTGLAQFPGSSKGFSYKLRQNGLQRLTPAHQVAG